MKGALSPYTAAIILVLTLCVAALTWHGSIDGQAAVGYFTGALGILGGSAAVSHGVRQGSQATVDPPPEP